MGRSWDYSLLVHGKTALTSNQGIEAPIAAASRGHVEEDETEQHGGHPLILNRPAAIREVKLPIGDRHHPRQNECNRPSEETEHDQDAAKEFQYSANACLRHQANLCPAGHSAEPPEQNQAAGLNE